MGRSPCCDESGLKKGPWTPEEDQKLTTYINKHGHGSWRALPKLAGLNRCGKSCRLRWSNYLRPHIKRGKFSKEEEQTILNLHAVLGNKWSAIATHLPGRTDNEIKNFWNTHLEKKLIQMGYYPMTHRPRTDIFNSLQHLVALANLKELIENHSWEEQAMRLHYLQNLLPQPHNNMSTLSAVQNVEAYNLLNSLKDSQFLGTNNHLGNHIVHQIPSNLDQPIQDSITFSHFPELHTPCSFQTCLNKDKARPQDIEFTVLSHEETSPASSWLPPLSPSLPPPPLPVINDQRRKQNSSEVAISSCLPEEMKVLDNFFQQNNERSLSNEGAPPSIWSDLLLEDSFFQDIDKF